jgi:hypothetical protein
VPLTDKRPEIKQKLAFTALLTLPVERPIYLGLS